jgi:hypothetical protein
LLQTDEEKCFASSPPEGQPCLKMATAQQKAFCVLLLAKTSIVILVQRDTADVSELIRQLVATFTVGVSNFKKTVVSGRPRVLEETSLPAMSTDAPRQLLQTTALCVLRKRLAIQGYMLQLVQHLKPDDKFKLYDLCVETQAHMANLRSAWFSARRSDISLKRGSESPQYTHLGAENSHHERHLSAKVNVFRVISRRKTYGPFFVMKARSPGLRELALPLATGRLGRLRLPAGWSCALISLRSPPLSQ